jgi:uncharacterized phage protein (TIGR01671 family)
MNRQIKFRVWCKVQNKFEYDWQKVISSSYNYRDEKYPNGIDVTNDELLAVQQFTGLTDKNGEEIYEGDVVKTNCLKGEVVFRSGSWLFNGHPLINYEESLVIVGNVLENPELIQK